MRRRATPLAFAQVCTHLVGHVKPGVGIPAKCLLGRCDLGIAERYDIVIDFAQPHWPLNTTVWLVNLAEHEDGRLVARDLSLTEALSGQSPDPGVGKILEFRILRAPSYTDNSQVPEVLIPNPDLTNVKNVRTRNFEFGRGADQTINDPQTASEGEWGIRVRTDSDSGDMLAAAGARMGC